MANDLEATPDHKTALQILQEIETKIASIDSLATSDAFALGRLVQEYGYATRAEATDAFMKPLLSVLTKPREPRTDKPWLPGEI